MEKQTKSTAVMTAVMLLVYASLTILCSHVGEAAQSPKPEGSLVIAQSGFAQEGFLPDRGHSAQSPIWELVYDQLIYMNHKTVKPIPGLAVKWEPSKDSRTLTLTLRKGVPWQEGWGQVTAEDVKYTVERLLAPGSTNTFSGALRKQIEGIKVIDPYTVSFQLKKPDPFFYFNFVSTHNPFLPIVCKKYLEKVGDDAANKKPIGSGPYRLVEQRLGEYLKFEALDNHWKVIPEFKYVTLRVIPEESTRVAMLQTGEIDICEVPPAKAAQLKQAGLNVVKWPGNAISFHFGGMTVREDKRYVEGRSQKMPWADIRVREAMLIALDRDAIAKTVYFGSARPFPLWGQYPGWDALEVKPYNPKRAKALLVEAGYPNGFDFKVGAHPIEGAPEVKLVAEACAGYWEQIGLRPKLDMTDHPSSTAMVVAGKDYEYVTPKRTPYAPFPFYKIGQYRMPNGEEPCFQHNEITALGKKLDASMDWDEKVATMSKLSKLDHDLYATIPVVMAERTWGFSKKVGEWPVGPRVHVWNYAYIRHPKPLNTWRLFTP